MINLKKIYPLSDFVRNAKTRLTQLAKSGQPDVLTVNGEAQVVILSIDAYQKLLEDLETAQTLNVAHQGMLEAFRSGKISAGALMENLRPQPHLSAVPAREVFAELERKFMNRRKKKAS